MNFPKSHPNLFWGILLLALVVRIAALIVYSENLLDDRDSYVRIAANLAAGRGFSATGETPTAFRPPLYPIVLAPGFRILGDSDSGRLKAWIGGLNLLFSLATVAGVLALAGRHFHQRVACLAGILTALNPFLVYQITLPMTETLFAFLCVGLIGALSESQPTRVQRIATGVWFALAALCRPTVWAFAILAVTISLAKQGKARNLSGALRSASPTLLAALLLLAPWIVRNAIVMDHFIPMTTHGGYTLLLGNNRVFYEEVVATSWRETWDGESLNAWQQSLDEQMRQSQPPVVGEVARNRWMSALAWKTIRSEPVWFLKSCVVRFLRFWNPVPLTSDQQAISTGQSVLLAGYWLVLVGGALIATVLYVRDRRLVAQIVILVTSTTLLHLVYWSNVRMRVPLEPLLAILAAAGIDWWRSRRSPGTPDDQRSNL